MKFYNCISTSFFQTVFLIAAFQLKILKLVWNISIAPFSVLWKGFIDYLKNIDSKNNIGLFSQPALNTNVSTVTQSVQIFPQHGQSANGHAKLVQTQCCRMNQTQPEIKREQKSTTNRLNLQTTHHSQSTSKNTLVFLSDSKTNTPSEKKNQNKSSVCRKYQFNNAIENQPKNQA